MLRFREKTWETQLFVRVRLPLSNRICESEAEEFSEKAIRGFLRLTSYTATTAAYTGHIGIPLVQWLEKPVIQHDFFLLVAQVVKATQQLQRSGLPWNRVIWDVHRVYITETTKELQFLYLPMEGITQPPDLLAFLEQIVYSVKLAPSQDSGFLSNFIYFIKEMPNYSVEKIETYLRREAGPVMQLLDRSCPLEAPYAASPYAAPPYAAPPYDATQRIHQPGATELLTEETKTVCLANDQAATTELLTPSNTVLLHDPATTRLQQTSALRFPTLTRCKTGETISVNKAVFRVGKERSYVDYFVADNDAVSRSHMDLITRDGRYYAVDKNSCNKTYCNGTQLAVNQEYEVHDGDHLTLANEEFIFHI